MHGSLPTSSKIFEKHVNSHLMGYLNKHKLIHECQSGFRQKHSCNTALVKLIDKWMASINFRKKIISHVHDIIILAHDIIIRNHEIIIHSHDVIIREHEIII